MKQQKNKKKMAFNITLSLGALGLLISRVFDHYTVVKQPITEAITSEKAMGKAVVTKELDDIYNNLSEISLSDNTKQMIESICDFSIAEVDSTYNSKYLDILEINTKTATEAYCNLKDTQVFNHSNTYYYDYEKDDIKWDLLADKIYENSLLKEQEKQYVSALSLEEIKEKLKNMQSLVQQLRLDYPDYDIKELACKLTDYSFVWETNIEDLATTNADTIAFSNHFSQNPLNQAATDCHESFHVCLKSCEDIDGYEMSDFSRVNSGIHIATASFPKYDDGRVELDNLCLERYRYKFLEEIYAELYSTQLLGAEQDSYTYYDEVLLTIQLVLGLQDDYKIDSILRDLVYHDPISFIKHFPVYGENKEEYFLDNCKMLKSLDILLDVPDDYNKLLEEKNLKEDYFEVGTKNLYQTAVNQMSKLFFHNLIMMNEIHSDELTIEDNYCMINLFDAYLNKTYQSISELQQMPNDKETSLEQENFLLNKNFVHFLNYLGDKYQTDGNDMLSSYLTYTVPSNYEFPDFMEEDKKVFYNELLQVKNQNISIPYSMTLKK